MRDMRNLTLPRGRVKCRRLARAHKPTLQVTPLGVTSSTCPLGSSIMEEAYVALGTMIGRTSPPWIETPSVR